MTSAPPIPSTRLLAILLVLLITATGPIRADTWKRPRVFLILCDGLTLNDVHLSDNTNPDLANLARHGTLALMNCAVPAPKTDTAAMLALASGQQTPAEKTDEQAANDWEKAPGEKISAMQSYRVRLGLPLLPQSAFDTHHSIKHLGIADLKRRGLDTTRLGALLANAKPRIGTWIVGNADTAGWRRRGALLTVDGMGIGSGLVALRSYDPRLPYGLTDSPPTLVEYAQHDGAGVTVIQLGDGARAEIARPHLSPADYQEAHDHAMHLLNDVVALLLRRLKGERADILIVAPRPPSLDALHPDAWDHLTPIIGYGPDFPPGTFESATTRSPGLIANVDVAPTILALFHLPVPPSMIGRPMQIISEEQSGQTTEQRLAQISRLDFVSWANAAALAPVLAVLGIFGFLSCMGGLLAIRAGSTKTASVFAMGLIFVLNFPAAQLFAPIFIPPTLVEYGLRIAAWMLVLTILVYGLARLLRVSLPVAVCLLNIAAVLADVLTGQHLLKDALISNYYLPGFRYYGIGNDYLGFLLGYSLAGAFSLVDDRWERRRKRDGAPGKSAAPLSISTLAAPAPHAELEVAGHSTHEAGRPTAGTKTPRRIVLAILLCWIAVTFILGWPTLGANSGSLIVTSVAFGVGWLILCGRRFWWSVIPLALLGIGLSFGFAFLDARLHGARSAHAGAVLIAASAGRGIGYLWTIVQRKALFNVSLLAAPWTWVTASLIGGALLLAPMLAEQEIEETRQRRAMLTRSVPAIAAAAIASLLFKDSGVTTVCYLVGSMVAVGFYYLLTPNTPAWLLRGAERN